MDQVKPTIAEVRPLVEAIYRRHGVGCCLHIVLDDANAADGHVSYCLDLARREQHPDCEKLAGLLLLMSKTQRLKLAATT